MWSALVISHQSGLVMSAGWVVKSVQRGSVKILNKFQTFFLSHMLSKQLTNFKPSSLSHMLLWTLSYFSHSNSHTFLSTTLIVLSQQLSYFSHRTSYYYQKISYAAKHCSSLKSYTSPTFIVVSLSHSHTISTVHLHILMSGKDLFTL